MRRFLILLFFSLVGLVAGSIYTIYIRPLLFPQDHPTLVALMESTESDTSSHSLTPLISNQWYSSIYQGLPTAPLYALPLVTRFTHTGIEIGYPQVTRKTDEIDSPFQANITIVPEGKLQAITPVTVGDWNIQVKITNEQNESMTASIGHGIPFVTLTTTMKQLAIDPNGKFSIKKNGKTQVDLTTRSFSSNNFLLQVGTTYYCIAFPKKTTILLSDQRLYLENPTRIFIGLLDNPEHYSSFVDISPTDIVDTRVYPSIHDKTLQAQYVIKTNNTDIPLIALYPHQSENIVGKISPLGTYATIRGTLQLIKANTFTTTYPLIVPPTTFDPLTTNHPDVRSQIHDDIQTLIHNGPPDSHDYFLGTWFGKAANLLLLADAQGLQEDKQQLLEYIEPIFLNSFSFFEYDKTKTSLIAKQPEFGNEQLNDHHFHYGYYIRLGAVIASFDPSKLSKIQKLMTPMIQDIGTTQRASPQYPFLRNFDVYESHSWADGYGNSDFGNNQESSSEAINAWYGLYLWSQVVHDTTLLQYALYLYNAEIIGASYYWFDQDSLYTPPYQHAIASQVWGGKINFATWFSSETNMKYGIQLLPFTPGSDYLGNFVNFTKYDTDYHQHGGNEKQPWGDLFTMWESYYQPNIALNLLDQVTNLEGDNPRSLFLYEVYKNEENKK